MRKFLWVFLFPLSLWANILRPSIDGNPASPYYELYDHQAQKVGHIASYELPVARIVIIHSLYVPPLHRAQGYAQKMLSEVISHYKQQGYSTAYIQIGPYEKGQYLDEQSDEYHKRILKLQQLYTKFGFQPAPWYEQSVAGLLYPILGIHASSEYLLKRDLSAQSEDLLS